MRKLTITIIILINLLLAGCAQNTPVEPVAALKVGDGSTEKSYTSAQLEGLGAERASFNDVIYLGVPLSVLITDAGFDPAQVKAVKAVAADGFSANYDASLFQKSGLSG